ncbi:hypothetical protein [uncultured Vagococcus sp.]|uniref:hypothetical protein n=1 Tax=uncultured Vagococcus sp. TaxID=189676 RepID=UPI0025860DD0|nr:hypothetical protein [uncultured Vagococcus sp.]
METVIKIVTIAGSIYGASGLIGLLIGWRNFQSGTKHDDPVKAEKGAEQMLWGGSSAGIAAGVVVIITAALRAITF